MSRPRISDSDLLAAVALELREHGLRSFSMTRVAEAADCSRATVYRRFPTKQAALTQLLEHEAARVIERLTSEVGRADDRRQPLVGLVVAAIRAIRDETRIQPFFQPDCLGTTLELAAASPSLLRQVTELAQNASVTGAASRRWTLVELDWLFRCILSIATVDGLRRPPTEELTGYVERYVVGAIWPGD